MAVSFGSVVRRGMTLLLAGVVLSSSFAVAAERKLKTKVVPQYPEIARKSRIGGTVKLQIVIAANGSVKSVKPLGGHPMLIEAATDAVMRWKYETGEETTSLVELKFTLDE
jgi:TonB family protein